jgi:hypothetical protein
MHGTTVKITAVLFVSMAGPLNLLCGVGKLGQNIVWMKATIIQHAQWRMKKYVPNFSCVFFDE